MSPSLADQVKKNVWAIAVLVRNNEEVLEVLDHLQRNPLGEKPLLAVHSTISPECASNIWAKGLGTYRLIEMPLTGGASSAERGKLASFWYSHPAHFQAVTRFLAAYCDLKKATSLPNAGDPARLKVCNQIAIAGNLFGAAECLALAQRLGLDIAVVRSSTLNGAAKSYSMEHHALHMVQCSHGSGIIIENLQKDLA